MFFWILLLAHVLGDFPFQTGKIYALKRTSFGGVLPHIFTCSALNLLALLPLLPDRAAWLSGQMDLDGVSIPAWYQESEKILALTNSLMALFGGVLFHLIV